MKINLNNIAISIEKDQDKTIKNEIIHRGIAPENIERIDYLKRSIDSRKKSEIRFVYNLEITLKNPVKDLHKDFLMPKEILEEERVPKKDLGKIAVIGTGPAGLFAALRLCQHGFKPVIFERGEMVDDRDKSIDTFYATDILNPNSNIQFGEGGAGTYSDGKLNTRIRSGYINRVFLELVSAGAQEEILWSYKPHVGTDILKVVVKNIREKIKAMGGEFHFNTLVENIVILDNKVKALEIVDKFGSRDKVPFDHVILGVGHSARDTYRMLHRNGVFMENKAFAVGARIEHPRRDIDEMQYGKSMNHPLLEAATYNLAYNNREEERGIFSFCMCPGGVIVNAASEQGGTLVNGMSYSTRDGEFSNSALVVGVKENEFGDHLFSGMEFQEQLERKTFELVNNYGALAQNTLDFLNDKTTTRELKSSYPMRMKNYDLNNLFPEVISKNMKSAMKYWEKTQRNFIGKNANLIAPETRTSAPVRITRNEFGESLNIKGLFPVGEGAGYAGGIVSAAVDGMRIVDLAFTDSKN
ncbi:MAG: NAD(P)/FAD-dependent oxidoreductase [Cetobacterium sp.]